MVETIDTLTTEKAVKLFEEFGVFTKAELESRREIKYEAYAKAINIEARTMLDVAGKQIILRLSVMPDSWQIPLMPL